MNERNSRVSPSDLNSNHVSKRGRPRKTDLQSHISRESLTGKHPLHLTLKVRKDILNLRTGKSLKALQTSAREARKFGLFVVHFTLQSNHLHMMVETKDNASLASGMKSFAGRLAKRINKLISERSGNKRKGSVFKDRFHMNVLKTSVAVRNVLRYIFANHSRHTQKKFVSFDFYSSALAFRHWKELFRKQYSELLDEDIRFEKECQKEFPLEFEELQNALSPPQFWLSRIGWLRVSA